MLPDFRLENDSLNYKEKLCIPRRNVRDILRMAHDSPNGGHLSYTKTLERLRNVYWKSKAKDIEAYCAGCLTFQTGKDGRSKLLGSPQPLEVPTRRWGSVSMEFITHMPENAQGFD